VRCAGHFRESGKAFVVYLSLGDLKWAPTFKWDVRDTSVKVSVLWNVVAESKWTSGEMSRPLQHE